VTEDMGVIAVTKPHSSGEAPLPKRTSRGLVPSTWLGRQIALEYIIHDELRSASGALLDTFPVGLVMNLGGRKTLVCWEAVRLIELVPD
jgi:hypothetical protein